MFVCVCVVRGEVHIYFDNIVSQIYPSELQLNKANISDTEVSFLDLHFSISNDIVSTKLYDKRDDFDMVMLLVLHPIEFIFLNSSVLLEHLAMLQTSIRVMLVPLKKSPPVNIFTDRSNAVLLFVVCVLRLSLLSCLVCSLRSCGHLLRKG